MREMVIRMCRQTAAVAAAAKLLQSCPTLCYPIDSSPPGSPVPGILQARTLEWVAISFSSAWKWKVKSESEVVQSCPTLRDPMDCSLPDSSVHGIFQARVLEWGAIAFSDTTKCEGRQVKSVAFGWGIQPIFPDYIMREPEEILSSHFPPIHPYPAVLSYWLNPNGTREPRGLASQGPEQDGEYLGRIAGNTQQSKFLC